MYIVLKNEQIICICLPCAIHIINTIFKAVLVSNTVNVAILVATPVFLQTTPVHYEKEFDWLTSVI